MSFSADAKNEMMYLRRKDCCRESFLYDALLFSKKFSGKLIESRSRNHEITEFLLRELIDLGISESAVAVALKRPVSSLTITDPVQIDRIFNDFGHSAAEPYLTIKRDNFKCVDCFRYFAAGAFVSAGSIADPDREYNLEIVSYRMHLIREITEQLNEFGFGFNIRMRGNRYVSYIKNSDLIVDFLSFAGAPDSSNDIINLKIYKGIRNDTNRRVNFESSNIDKAINAAQEDIEAIMYLKKMQAYDSLPRDVREVAELRLNNPELSLAELGNLTVKTISKSGVAHRLKKLRDEANNLRMEKTIE